MTEKKRGGAGRGQGRKTADGAAVMRPYTVTLDQPTVDALRRSGDGNLSVGIRKSAKGAPA